MTAHGTDEGPHGQFENVGVEGALAPVVSAHHRRHRVVGGGARLDKHKVDVALIEIDGGRDPPMRHKAAAAPRLGTRRRLRHGAGHAPTGERDGMWGGRRDAPSRATW